MSSVSRRQAPSSGSMTLSKKLKQASDEHTIRHSRTLPQLSPRNESQLVYSMYQSQAQSHPKNPVSRLSCLPERVNTSALFSDKSAVPTKPAVLCVRCSSTHAALCMICAEQDCQSALTFYRKTRAAGAASLFSKAFIEAGYSKALKFVVFRLLRNSMESRKRVHLKKKTIVEKLFGANVVFIPFSAWKRYTQENILNRKNKNIFDLSERVKLLEAQVSRLQSTVSESQSQVGAVIDDNVYALYLMVSSWNWHCAG
jgi:hypothetical protein